MAKTKLRFPAVAVAPPRRTKLQWSLGALVGVLLLAMGISQLVSFSDFVVNLDAMNIGPPRLWGAIIVLAELWGAASLFKIRLSPAFRAVSTFFALFAGSFWFYQILRQLSEGNNVLFLNDGKYQGLSAGLFGNFLSQAPGWATLIETGLLIICLLAVFDNSRRTSTVKKRR